MAVAKQKPITTGWPLAANSHLFNLQGNEVSSYNVKPQAECDPPISILLIGSTGNGKSSLGNFLLDPSDEHIWRKKTFQTGITNKPSTKEVQYAYNQKRNPSLLVIDTPGLNESVEKDSLHMSQVVQTLKDLKSITACVLCIKFDSKIDAQYKATIAYYKKLLPMLFERNVAIVLTNFKTDERSVRMRQIQGVNVDVFDCNTKREVVKSGELSFIPQVFKIDSLPMSEEERRTSEQCRFNLLNYIKQTLKPISVKDLRTAERKVTNTHVDSENYGYTKALKEIHVDTAKSKTSSYNAEPLATSAPPQPLSILLIGSTGNGKSSLGNFLLDPSNEHIFWNTTFHIAHTDMPDTQRVQCAHSQDVPPSLLVIDTPDKKDLSNMIQVVKTLKSLKSITACVFCIKFNTKIDAQYKATVAYYRRLLPSLFEGNVIIVLTNFPTDRHSVLLRRRQGVDVNAIVRNAQDETVESGNLSFVPPVFLINSYPTSEEERRTSESCRLSILGYIKQSLQPIWIKELYVAKTPALKKIDEKEIKHLDGEIHRYNMRLKEVNKEAKAVLDDIEQAQKEATELKGEIRNIEAEINEMDSPQKVTVKVWNLHTSWKRFRLQSESFDITAEYPIVDAIPWDNGHLKWKEFEWSKDPGRAYGKVEGKWFQGLYATVTLLTEKRIKYMVEIALYKYKLTKMKEAYGNVVSSIARQMHLKKENQSELDLLNEYIEERNKRKEELSADPISIEEAYKRVAEISTKTVE